MIDRIKQYNFRLYIPIPQLIEAHAKLRDGTDAVYPYSGRFYDTSRLLREVFWKNRDIQFLQKNIAKMKLIYGENMKGGAFMINRSVYWEIFFQSGTSKRDCSENG